MGAGASNGGGAVVQSRPKTSPAVGKTVMNGTSGTSNDSRGPPKSAVRICDLLIWFYA